MLEGSKSSKEICRVWKLIKVQQEFGLSRTTLALTYVLCLLLATGSQFQRKVLKDRIRSCRNRRKCVVVDTGL